MIFQNRSRHKVFVSYHHANDEMYKKRFIKMFDNIYDIMISKSVELGDIDPNNTTEYVRKIIRNNYLRDSTVTVVLIGNQTWQRKHVDWEIASSLRQTEFNPRSGLLGIVLPTNLGYDRTNNTVKIQTIPPRLADNLDNGFAKIYYWNEEPNTVASWIEKAFQDRNKIIPDNSRPMYGKNRTGDS